MPFFRLATTNRTPAKKSSVVEDFKSQHAIKLYLLGDRGVGKSSLLLRWVDDTFSDRFFVSIGNDSKVKTIELENTEKTYPAKVQMQVFDGELKDVHLTGMGAILVVFDTTNLETFNNVQRHIIDIQRKLGTANIVLVGTKTDLVQERKVESEYVEAFINGWNGDDKNKDFKIAGYVETSAKYAVNIDDLFEMTARSVMDKRGCWQARKPHPKESNEIGKLYDMLGAYIIRIESYRGAGSDIDYSHGFMFFSKSRAINRKINYLLAKELKQELDNMKDISQISQVFSNLEERRKTIMTREGLDRMADYVDRGMNSSDLKTVIKLAEQIVTGSEASEGKTTQNIAGPR